MRYSINKSKNNLPEFNLLEYICFIGTRDYF